MGDEDYNEKITERYHTFNNAFSDFQRKGRTIENYYQFQAFKDFKVCVILYSEIYEYLGYHQLVFPPSKLESILTGFDCYQKRELILFFIKKLTEKGNEEVKNEFSRLLNITEIQCYWTNILKLESIFRNLIALLLKLSSFNFGTLLFTMTLIFIFTSILFLPAPFENWKTVSTQKLDVSQDYFKNHLANVLLYFFGINENTKFSPLNIPGVLLLVFLRILTVVFLGNFLIKKLTEKINFK